MERVVIIGAGAIGSAIERLLRSNRIKPEMWDIDPKKVTRRMSLSEIVPRADVMFVCVASWSVRAALASIAPHLSKQTAVVLLAKGIEPETGLTMDRFVAHALPGQPFALLAGPMLAKEIMLGKPAAAVIATKNKKASRLIRHLFVGTTLSIDTSSDVRGVALCGVLKNIYAIGFGIADGLAWGANEKGMLATQSLNEMRDILPILGGRAETALGQAGLADLIATGFSRYSKNHALGVALAKTGKAPFQTEGRSSLPFLASMLGKRTRQVPLLEMLVQVLSRCSFEVV